MAARAARAEVPEEIERAEELERLTEAEERGEVERPPMHRARPSEVFSVRLPEPAAAELRRLADEEGVSAGILLRRWALTVLTGDGGEWLNRQQAEDLFRDALQRAAVEMMSKVVEREPLAGVNLGPRLVHRSLRDRRTA